MGFTYTDSDKVVQEAWGKFKVTLLEAVEPGDLMNWYNTDNAYTVQFADQGDSQRADCIAMEKGAAGDEITACLKAVLGTISTIATGGVVTPVYFAGADDYLGAPLYLGEDGKPSSSEGGTHSQTVGRLLARDRVLIDLVSSDIIDAPMFTGTAQFGGSAVPTTNNGAALGTTSKKWSDLFLATGAVINFNSGDITITHSTDQLLIVGGLIRITRTFAAVSGNQYSLRVDAYPTMVSGASVKAIMCITECLAGTLGVNAIGINAIAEMDSTKRITGFLTAGTFSLINAANAMGGMGCIELTWKNTATAPSVPGTANHAYMIMREYSSGGGTVCCSLFWFGDITVGSASASALFCENGNATTPSHVLRFMVKNVPYWILCDSTPPA